MDHGWFVIDVLLIMKSVSLRSKPWVETMNICKLIVGFFFISPPCITNTYHLIYVYMLVCINAFTHDQHYMHLTTNCCATSKYNRRWKSKCNRYQDVENWYSYHPLVYSRIHCKGQNQSNTPAFPGSTRRTLEVVNFAGRQIKNSIKTLLPLNVCI